MHLDPIDRSLGPPLYGVQTPSIAEEGHKGGHGEIEGELLLPCNCIGLVKQCESIRSKGYHIITALLYPRMVASLPGIANRLLCTFCMFLNSILSTSVP